MQANAWQLSEQTEHLGRGRFIQQSTRLPKNALARRISQLTQTSSTKSQRKQSRGSISGEIPTLMLQHESQRIFARYCEKRRRKATRSQSLLFCVSARLPKFR